MKIKTENGILKFEYIISMTKKEYELHKKVLEEIDKLRDVKNILDLDIKTPERKNIEQIKKDLSEKINNNLRGFQC